MTQPCTDAWPDLEQAVRRRDAGREGLQGRGCGNKKRKSRNEQAFCRSRTYSDRRLLFLSVPGRRIMEAGSGSGGTAVREGKSGQAGRNWNVSGVYHNSLGGIAGCLLYTSRCV